MTLKKNDFHFTDPKGHLYSQVGVSLFKVVTTDVHENESSMRAGTLYSCFLFISSLPKAHTRHAVHLC